MEQTLQAQYNLIKEGKGNKAYFLKSAYRLFPDMLSPVNTFEDTVKILKNRSVISEGIGGLVTTGKKQDWHSIFNENMDKLKENSDMDKHNLGVLKALLDDAIKNQDQDSIKYLKGEIAKIEGDEFTAAIDDFEEKDAADANISPINYRNLKEDYAAVKKENIKKAFEYYNQNAGRISMKDAAAKFGVNEFEVMMSLNPLGANNPLKEAKEVKEPSKEVLDNQKNNFDYKDEKNYDNLFGQEFLQGYYTEMKEAANADKDVEELRAIVAKNLAKDKQYYVKNGQFGTKGLGYTTEAPGLGEPKEPKGKFASSGYGDIPKSSNLQESILRSQIHLLIKEVLDELQQDPKAYADEEEFETKVLNKLKNDSDAKKYFEKHSVEITKKFFNHSKSEGGVSDAVKYILTKAESNPIHEEDSSNPKKSSRYHFSQDLQQDPEYQEFKKNANKNFNITTKDFGYKTPNVADDDPYLKKKKYTDVDNELNITSNDVYETKKTSPTRLIKKKK